MRIVQIIDSLLVGGAQSLLVTFAREAMKQGHEVTVVSLFERRATLVDVDLHKLGVPVRYLPGSHLFDPVRVRALMQIFRDTQAEVVHTHLLYSNVLGAIAARRAGVPVVASLHNEANDPGIYNYIKTLAETTVLRRYAQRIIAVGHMVEKAQSKRFLPKAVEVILNAVQIPELPTQDEREEMRRLMVGDPGLTILLTIGRLARQKGLPDLLESVNMLRDQHPEVRLVIIGEGSLRPVVEAKIEELDLQNHAILFGQRKDVVDLLAAGDLYVSASHWEGLPVAVLEAMAAGLPVVATEVGDLPYVVLPGTGCLVPPHQPEQLAKAIDGVLVDAEKLASMRQAAREAIISNHNPENWVKQLLSLYRAVQVDGEAA